MKRAVLFVCLLAAVMGNAASAVEGPLSGWNYFSWPYMYNFGNQSWYYLHVDSGEPQWVCNLQSGAWGELGKGSPPNGFMYFMMPYVYSHSNTTWNYMNRSDNFWIYNLTTGLWSGKIPSADFAGTWVGTFQDTSSSDNYSPLERGYIVADVSQDGNQVTVTLRPDNEMFTGTGSGNGVTLSGVGSNDDMTCTLSGDTINVSYAGGDAGGSWAGTATLQRAGTRENIAGTWQINYSDQYSSGPLENGSFQISISQNGNLITITGIPNTGTVTGYIEGNTFVAYDSADGENMFIGGQITGNSMTGTYSWEDGEDWGWGEISGSR